MAKNDKVHQFLMGLDDDAYSTVRSQILALDTLPTLDKVFNMVKQEKAHKGVMINYYGGGSLCNLSQQTSSTTERQTNV